MTASPLLQPVAEIATAVLCQLNRATNLTLTLPILMFYPTSRCNSRCVSCDWWRSGGEDDLTLHEIEDVVTTMPSLGTRLVAFSGGEPLARSDVFEIARLFRSKNVTLHLLTSGLALERYAREVGALFSRVTISLDAATPEDYRAIRGVDGLRAVEGGVARLRAHAPNVRITARSTLHALNYLKLPSLIRKARSMSLDGISFLAADVSSDAFGRGTRAASDRLRLNARQTAEFRGVIERVVRNEREAFVSGFVMDSAEKLRRLPTYYAALNGAVGFPPVSCNAPWVSAVLEANGDVRPCFFHRPVGNVRARSFERIVREELPRFRRALNIACNDTCERCVCSIKVGLRNRPWKP